MSRPSYRLPTVRPLWRARPRLEHANQFCRRTLEHARIGGGCAQARSRGAGSTRGVPGGTSTATQSHESAATSRATARHVLEAIATLGVHLKSDGDPGWRGWKRLLDFEAAYQAIEAAAVMSLARQHGRAREARSLDDDHHASQAWPTGSVGLTGRFSASSEIDAPARRGQWSPRCPRQTGSGRGD